MFLGVGFNQGFSGFSANIPGGFCGYGANINGVKVFTCGQDFGAAAGGCARSTALDVFAIKSP